MECDANRIPLRAAVRDERKRLEEIIGVIKRHNIVKNGLTPETLRRLLEDLGPTFIKIGQIMSSRTDLLPKAYCQELEKLRAEVKPLPKEEMVAVIEAELGCSVDEVFSSFGDRPLGSASIAQVYSAELKDGRKVVVKVQRPYVAEMMMQDFALLSKAARMLKLAPVNETVDFDMVVRELREVSREELDFLVEAGHTREFYENCRDLKYASCPVIEDSLTTSKVMTMSFIDGFSVADQTRLAENGYDRTEIAMKLIDHYIRQIIDDGFFHADPHQGNIVISGGQIVWLDMGMMGRLSNREKNLMRMAITAVVQRDVNMMKSAIISLGECRAPINHPKLFADIDMMMERYCSMELADVDIGAALEDVMTLATEHRIALPQGISMLARGLVTIEGVVNMLSGDINLVDLVSGRVLSDMIERLDLKKELAYNVQAVYDSAKKSLSIPSLTADMMKSVIKGHTKLNLELVGYEPLIRQLNRIAVAMIICIITAALLLASSLLCMTDMQPKLLGIPALGMAGYVAALVLGVYLLITTIRKRSD